MRSSSIQFSKVLLSLLVVVLLAACSSDSWFGDDEEDPLEGERITVLPKSSSLDMELALDVNETCSPPPEANQGDAVVGSTYIGLKRPLREAWRHTIGEGSTNEARLMARPVVAMGVVYTIDTEANVTAFSTSEGTVLWRVSVQPEDEDIAVVSGNIAYYRGLLIVATGYSEVIALDARTGQQMWRKTVAGPVRATPSVDNNRVYILTIDNQLEVRDAMNGELIWSHQGSGDVAGMLGGSRVAVGDDVAVVPYSTGELYALKSENGRVLWAENLTAIRRKEGSANLSDIIAWPVVNDNQIFAVTVGGTMASINLVTGRRLWEAEIGGSQTPEIAGNYLYAVTNTGHAGCLSRNTGRIFWLRDLNEEAEEKDEDKPKQHWFGPVYAGERLIVVSENGEVLSMSPFDGRVQGSFMLPAPVHVAPVVGNRTLFVLDDEGTLYAFR